MTKIEALRKTIYNLENDLYNYNWCSIDQCNCGLVAMTLLGGKLPTDNGYGNSPKRHPSLNHWSGASYCMTTNLSLPKVFQALKDAGFTHKELVNLEYYGDKRVAEKLGFKIEYRSNGHPFGYNHVQLDNKETAIKYMKAWLEILEADQLPPAIKETIRYVAVPEIISEQAIMIITDN